MLFQVRKAVHNIQRPIARLTDLVAVLLKRFSHQVLDAHEFLAELHILANPFNQLLYLIADPAEF